jgi:hypothetical protein
VRDDDLVTIDVQIGDWATLMLFTGDEAAPPALAAMDSLWRDDDRRLAATLSRHGVTRPYVAMWPTDVPAPALTGADASANIEGVVLAEVVLALTCFACGATFAGLYPDLGLPWFSENMSRHAMVSDCPSCGADYQSSRLQALALLRE